MCRPRSLVHHFPSNTNYYSLLKISRHFFVFAWTSSNPSLITFQSPAKPPTAQSQRMKAPAACRHKQLQLLGMVHGLGYFLGCPVLFPYHVLPCTGPLTHISWQLAFWYLLGVHLTHMLQFTFKCVLTGQLLTFPFPGTWGPSQPTWSPSITRWPT